MAELFKSSHEERNSVMRRLVQNSRPLSQPMGGLFQVDGSPT
eukprot:CAMPEP_0195136378 /NCGR_PEP_ID=MMETSP0448-20130528/154118_1 /TAXON_ID=66468 /ORGANISM="Heterocapsa triquestra, Strain CCMP 448" /LENGTH=41 /DNA_ID= /DNA_START= /DNA_END= /DNA_ORIENTATION=